MFIINLDELGIDKSNLYICDKHMSEKLLKNGFSLLSSNYDENKYIFMKTDKLLKFIMKGGEQ